MKAIQHSPAYQHLQTEQDQHSLPKDKDKLAQGMRDLLMTNQAAARRQAKNPPSTFMTDLEDYIMDQHPGLTRKQARRIIACH